MKLKATQQRAAKKTTSAKAKNAPKDDDLFGLITLNWSHKKKIAAINAIPTGHASLSEIRESTNDLSIKKCTPFMWAVYKCEFELARCLIERGADWRCPCYMVPKTKAKDAIRLQTHNASTSGMREISALEMITAKNGLSLLRFLLQQKLIENINQVVNTSNQTMAHMIAKYGHCEMMNLLVEFHADINCEDHSKNRPLVYACHFGHEGMVACLIRHNVVIDFTVDNLTFLSWFDLKAKEPPQTFALAITGEQFEVSAKNFRPIAKHLEVFAPTQEVILLQLFVLIENTSFTEALVTLAKYTGNIDVVSPNNGRAILHVIAKHVSDEDNVGFELAKAVLARKPNLNIRSKPGNTIEDPGFTPLHLACEFGREKMMILLLCHQAKINCTTDSGMTPLHLAAMQGRITIVRYLCKRYQQLDLSIDPLSKGEVTPLIMAVAYRKTEAVKILLSYGADPEKSSGLAGSVILVAIDKKHGEFIPEILERLIQECVKRPPPKIDVTLDPKAASTFQKQSLQTPTEVFFPKGFTLSSNLDFQLDHVDKHDLSILSNTISKIKESRNSWIRNFEFSQRHSGKFIWIGDAPILYAIDTECLPAIEILLQNARYRSPFFEGENVTELAFKAAFDLKKSKSLKVVIDQFSKLYTESPFSIPLSTFVQAVALDETKIVRILLESGRVENLTRKDFSLMIVLLKFSNEATLRELIRFGFDFNDPITTHAFSYIGFLITNKKYHLARCLLEQKHFDVNKLTGDNSTSLMYACFLEDQQLSVQFINLLMKHGADCMAKHNSGLNVLHIAIILNNTLAAKALVMHQPSLISNALVTLANGKITSLAHLCIMNDAIWLIKHRLLRNETTFTQRDSEGLSVRDLALQNNQLEIIQIIEEVCVEKIESIQTYDMATHNENFTGRQYLLKVLGFTTTGVQKLQSAIKAPRSDPIHNKDSPTQLAVVVPVTATYFSGRFTLFNTTSKLRRTENIHILADWQAIGEMNDEELRSFKEVLERPKLVITGVGVKHIGRHSMQIRLSDDAPYNEYPCCYEIKIASSKSRVLCIQVNADSKNGPTLLVACHYMPRGLHAQRDNKRLEGVIQKTLRIFDTTDKDNPFDYKH
ncbi:MAG: ankyrin repeat domain-containing protein [Pseudomonadota bacterium]|nr:ankyrin repeat domain-containing protein [Pseudomonadota bacterium]